ncbi:hypothetical protein BU26DRAFT_568831 [Trematosphaeria pertusa]|uniref:Protein kinase domain-containing protein n=1 Tax=Trematosphaeria pertusa TaxID=390896 RepID=A0A6A6I3H3_9PLEO|nr:uncharacterized protein BU26DRAFT_568831 [Trematosphaeria pertusa]KAF2244836.1 hypothetical protein BU26DRAFT_568831 [Trematosphaeria pertusa]
MDIPHADIPPAGDYKLYKKVTYGGNATIWYGLHKDDEANFRKSDPPKGIEYYSAVRERLVAVKIPFNGISSARESAVAEVEALQHVRDILQSTTSKDLRNNFVEIREHEKLGDRVEWIAMPAIQGVSLYTLHLALQLTKRWTWSEAMVDQTLEPRPTATDITRLYNEELIPVEFVFHVFLNVGRALQSLHESGWAHGDIKERNIMVSSPRRAIFPDLVLLDFGSAWSATQEKTKVLVDIRSFCDMMYCLAESHRYCEHRQSGCKRHPQEWDDFVKAMADGAETPCKSMKEVIRQFEGVAERCRNSADTKIQGYVGVALRAATKREESLAGITDAELKKALFPST